MTTSLIKTVLGVSAEQFLALHWPDSALHSPGALDRLAELTSHEELSDVARLIEANPGRAWLHRTADDGRYDHETSVDASTAAQLYEQGEMMDIRDVQTWIPVVHDWLARFHTELALDAFAHGGYCHAFVSPAGTGVPKHFDNREVIVIQLVGRKRWQIAPRTLPFPLMPHVAGEPIHPLNRAAVQTSGFESLDDPEMGKQLLELTLEPGDAFFVPRGMWHRTRALEDSLSLSFGLRIPSWAELFVNTALQELAKDPGWRATARDLAHDRGSHGDQIVETMRRAIGVLRDAPPQRNKPPETS